MRILQLHTHYRQRGGEDAVVEAERHALVAAGHEVFQHLELNPVRPVAAALAFAGSSWNPSSARRVAATIRSTRPDVVHVHNTWFALSPAVLPVMRRHGVASVMTVHNYRLACANGLFLRDGAPCERCLDHSALEAIRNRCYHDSLASSAVAATAVAVHGRLGTWSRYIDRFIVLSEFASGRLARSGIPREKMSLSSNFVADPGVRPAPPSQSRDVLFVGRVSREKGLHVLLEAWSRARPENLRLIVIGDGPDRSRCESEAPPGVFFLGRMEPAAVLERMHHARALIIPSIWYEGQPITALEGLATGAPLVVSDLGGLPEVLGEDPRAGWKVPPAHPELLAEILLRLADDGRQVDEYGAAGRRRYLTTHTPAAAVDRLEEVYALTRMQYKAGS